MTANQPRTMRDVFIEGIRNRMRESPRIFFVSADFGSPALDKLREEFKDRFINVGIAEQNLINVAVGLALEGNVVYAYAIAPFITMRDYEQIRQSLSISSQVRPINVNLIGVGAGLSYDVSGPTHHCLEDISMMRLLPNMTVFSPSDWKLTEAFIDYSIGKKTPKYLRFDSKPLPLIYDNINDLNLEDGFYELLKGEKICLVSTGFMTHRAIKSARGVGNIGVLDVFLLKSLREEIFFEALRRYEAVITIEEGLVNVGGLDVLVSKILRDNNSSIRMKNLGFDDKYVFELGGRDYLHKMNNLNEEAIIKTVKELI